jgi:hypothetical protein
LAGSELTGAGADTTLATAVAPGATRAFASAAASPTRRIASSRIVLAEPAFAGAALAGAALTAALAGALLLEGAATATLAAGAASTLAVRTWAAIVVSNATSLGLSTRLSTGFTALLVAALFVAFVTLAGAVALVTARRLVVALRSVDRVVLLLRAAWAFGALAVLFFRISTVVVFLSDEFLRAAALLFEVPARVIVLALLAVPVLFAV